MARVVHCAFRSTAPAGAGVITIIASTLQEAERALEAEYGRGSKIEEHEFTDLVCYMCRSADISHRNKWGRVMIVACSSCASQEPSRWTAMPRFTP